MKPTDSQLGSRPIISLAESEAANHLLALLTNGDREELAEIVIARDPERLEKLARKRDSEGLDDYLSHIGEELERCRNSSSGVVKTVIARPENPADPVAMAKYQEALKQHGHFVKEFALRNLLNYIAENLYPVKAQRHTIVISDPRANIVEYLQRQPSYAVALLHAKDPGYALGIIEKMQLDAPEFSALVKRFAESKLVDFDHIMKSNRNHLPTPLAEFIAGEIQEIYQQSLVETREPDIAPVAEKRRANAEFYLAKAEKAEKEKKLTRLGWYERLFKTQTYQTILKELGERYLAGELRVEGIDPQKPAEAIGGALILKKALPWAKKGADALPSDEYAGLAVALNDQYSGTKDRERFLAQPDLLHYGDLYWEAVVTFEKYDKAKLMPPSLSGREKDTGREGPNAQFGF